MLSQKDKLNAIMEFSSSFLIVYLSWTSFYAVQKAHIEQGVNNITYLSIANMALYMIIFYSVYYVSSIHVNPIITLYLYQFDLIKKKEVI